MTASTGSPAEAGQALGGGWRQRRPPARVGPSSASPRRERRRLEGRVRATANPVTANMQTEVDPCSALFPDFVTALSHPKWPSNRGPWGRAGISPTGQLGPERNGRCGATGESLGKTPPHRPPPKPNHAHKRGQRLSPAAQCCLGVAAAREVRRGGVGRGRRWRGRAASAAFSRQIDMRDHHSRGGMWGGPQGWRLGGSRLAE